MPCTSWEESWAGVHRGHDFEWSNMDPPPHIRQRPFRRILENAVRFLWLPSRSGGCHPKPAHSNQPRACLNFCDNGEFLKHAGKSRGRMAAFIEPGAVSGFDLSLLHPDGVSIVPYRGSEVLTPDYEMGADAAGHKDRDTPVAFLSEPENIEADWIGCAEPKHHADRPVSVSTEWPTLSVTTRSLIASRCICSSGVTTMPTSDSAQSSACS